MKNDISDKFHEESKLAFNKPEKYAKPRNPFVLYKIHYKSYPRFEQFKLPKTAHVKTTLEKAIVSRRSMRSFSGSISKYDLSNILKISAGITKYDGDWDRTLRAWPSAGARYPLEVYPVCLNIKGIKTGIYHYNVKSHSLEFLWWGSEYKKSLFKALDQKWIKKAACIFIITAVFNRTRLKYGQRGYRFALFDAGHLGQNFYLAATAHRIGCCAVGGFWDDKINKLLDIAGTDESAVYIIAIGKPNIR